MHDFCIGLVHCPLFLMNDDDEVVGYDDLDLENENDDQVSAFAW